jgi:hypothetical protein
MATMLIAALQDPDGPGLAGLKAKGLDTGHVTILGSCEESRFEIDVMGRRPEKLQILLLSGRGHAGMNVGLQGGLSGLEKSAREFAAAFKDLLAGVQVPGWSEREVRDVGAEYKKRSKKR